MGGLAAHNLLMKELFPYVGTTVIVTEEMCDFNGHMNVNHIKSVFEQGWEYGMKDFGFNEAYFEAGFSSFTLEDNYRFTKEFLVGDKIFPRFRLFNVNEKLFHMIGALFDKEGNLSAMYETVEGHIDMSLRKITPMKKSFLTNLFDIKQTHDALGQIPYEIRLKIRDLN
tara:strand:- start:838 stop:1344 length:507 start_codon:yes stop_codon:yes gene_type:complete